MSSDASQPEYPCPMCGETVTRETSVCPHCGETLRYLSETDRQLLQALRRQSRLLATVWVMFSALFCGIGAICLLISTTDLALHREVSTPWDDLLGVGFAGLVLGIGMAMLASACRARKFWAFYANLSLSYLFLAIGLILGSLLLILLLIGHVVLSHLCLRTGRRLVDASIPLDDKT